MSTRKRNKSAAPLLAAAIAMTVPAAISCSLDYQGLTDADDAMAQDVPNAILTRFTHTSVSEGRPVFMLSSERAEQFDAIKEIRMYSASFVEFDPKSGAVISSGKADFARYFSDTENAELSGNLDFDSKRDDIVLNGGYLYWNKAERKLTSRSDQTVSVSKSDGTSIRGEGFSADVAVKGFSFSGRTEGSWVIKDKKKDPESPESPDALTEHE